MSPNPIQVPDPIDVSSPVDIVSASARVHLFIKQHGLLAMLTLAMLYQIGVMASLQNQVCGL